MATSWSSLVFSFAAAASSLIVALSPPNDAIACSTRRPLYFATRKLDPAEARDFVRHALNVSRVLREMALAETAANLWAAILPGLAAGKPIDPARWVLLGADACEA